MDTKARERTDDLFPDPLVSANLYAAGRVGDVLAHVGPPLSRHVTELAGDRGRLWFVRYRCGGEHLKVRVHGPADVGGAVRQRLKRLAVAAFGEIPTGEPDEGNRGGVPIDEEDEVEEHPDRSLLFTHYRRSHVSLGGEPLLADDRHCAHLTTCLSRGAERLMELIGESAEPPPASQAQRLLLELLSAALPRLFPTAGQRAGYLAYHRDWLIRFPLLARGADEETGRRALKRLDGGAQQASAVVESLRDAVGGDAAAPKDDASPWQTALSRLQGRATELMREGVPAADPFVPHPSAPALFKAFHGVANQLGLSMHREAFIHHLLWRAVSPPGSALEIQTAPV